MKVNKEVFQVCRFIKRITGASPYQLGDLISAYMDALYRGRTMLEFSPFYKSVGAVWNSGKIFITAVDYDGSVETRAFNFPYSDLWEFKYNLNNKEVIFKVSNDFSFPLLKARFTY